MTRVIVLHSAYGLTAGPRAAALMLTAVGYQVEAPDLYRGRVAGTADDALALRDSIGRPAALERARRVVDGRPFDIAIGFSMGASFALSLVAEGVLRPACVLLFHGTGPLPARGSDAVRRLAVPVEVHLADPDPFEPEPVIGDWVSRMLDLGAPLDVHRYPGAGHLFTDPDVPDFHPSSSELAWARGRAFLARHAPPENAGPSGAAARPDDHSSIAPPIVRR